MNMIERVARAIAQADEQNGGPPYQYRIENKHSKEHLFDEAKAAIAAMRDLVKCCPDGNAADDRIVNEYIDAALKE